MKSITDELRRLVEDRVRNATPDELLSITALLLQETEFLKNRSLDACIEDNIRMTDRWLVTDDIVTDTTTDLVWTRQNVFSEQLEQLNWSQAKEVASDCTAGGYSDWCPPTVQELLTLVDYSRTVRTEPAIDTEVFECESSYYWTSTASWPATRQAVGVHFGTGHSNWLSQYERCYVRLVRGGKR